MIPCYTTRRSSNNRILFGILFLAAIFSSAPGHAQFRDKRDRQIVSDVLKRFGHECSLRAAADGDTVRRMRMKSDEARRSKNKAVQTCFETSFSQVSGVFFLYEKICNDVSKTIDQHDTLPDGKMARQLLDISRYQTGIRPFHSALNECLNSIPERKGRNFSIPMAGTELDIRGLQQQLDEIRLKDPFIATGEPLR